MSALYEWNNAQANDMIKGLVKEVMDVNQANGWFDDDRSFGDDMALLHSEVSEMFEAYRDGELVTKLHYKHATELLDVDSADSLELEANGINGKPVGVGSEAADILIRLLDTCGRYDINLFKEYRLKLDYNKTRAYRHGNKTV